MPFPMQVLVSSALMAGFIEAGKLDYVEGLAGQVSGLIKEIKPAGQLVAELVEETVEILSVGLPESVIVK